MATDLQLPEPPQDESALLTIEDAAAKLRVSPRYVQRLINEGQLNIIWLGQKTKRIDPQELYRLLRAKTLPMGSPRPADYKPRNRDMTAARAVLLRNRAMRKNAKTTTISSLAQAERQLRPDEDDDLVL